MSIACFNIRMKVVLDIKVSRTVGMSADQNSAERKNRNGGNAVKLSAVIRLQDSGTSTNSCNNKAKNCFRFPEK